MTDIITSIKSKLNEIEEKERVRIILAVESGSRAWGFASPDSDYDVRFIYVRQPENYIRLVPERDVIEWQLDEVYDIDGWDLQKALRLLHDSNPTLHEWCNSPIVYKENELAESLRSITEKCFLPKKALFHYLSMAEHTCRDYLTGEKVRLKKYFYALRPILAAKWVVDQQTAPPMLFEELVAAELEPEMKPVVDDLLAVKKGTPELGAGPHIPELDAYIKAQCEEIRQAAERAENRKNDWGELEEYFCKVVFGA